MLEAGCERDLGWAAPWEGARLRCRIATGASEQHGDNHALGRGQQCSLDRQLPAPARYGEPAPQPRPPFPPGGHQQETTNSLKSQRELPFQLCEAIHGLPKSQLGMHPCMHHGCWVLLLEHPACRCWQGSHDVPRAAQAPGKRGWHSSRALMSVLGFLPLGIRLSIWPQRDRSSAVGRFYYTYRSSNRLSILDLLN